MYREQLPEGPEFPSLDERILRAITSKDHVEAARLNTEGIALYPQNPKYPLGRAAANVFLKKFREALADALNALKLDPDNKIHRSLPYLQLGRAFNGLTNYDCAFIMADAGLDIDPEDWKLKQCQEFARVAGINKRAVLGTTTRLDCIGDTFDGGEMWLKLEQDEEARGYRHDPEFRKKVSEARKDNLKLGKHLREDKRVLKALGILLNVRFRENIRGAEPEAVFERQGWQDNEEGNEVPWQEKVRRDIIATVVDYGLPQLTNPCRSFKKRKREGEEMAMEVEVEEAELAKELLKLVLEGATITEEEERRS